MTDKLRLGNAALVVIVVIMAFIGVGQIIGPPFPQIGSITGSQLCEAGSLTTYYDESGSELDQPNWRIELRAPCSDHTVTGGAIIDNEDVNDGQKTAQSDFKFGINNLESWAAVEIQSSSKPVHDVESYAEVHGEQLRCGTLGDCTEARNQCQQFQDATPARDYKLDVEYKKVLSFTLRERIVCTRAVEVAEIGQFASSATTDFEGIAQLCSNGCESRRISKSDEGESVRLGSGSRAAVVQYAGSLRGDVLDLNLDTGRWKPLCGVSCASPLTGQNLKVVTDEQIDGYENSRDKFANNIESGDPDIAVNEHQAAVKSVQADQSRLLEEEIGSWVEQVEYDSGKLVVRPDDPGTLEIQSWILRISADWIGVDAQKTMPRIRSDSVSRVTTESDSSVDATVRVENQGESGRVDVSINCPAPLSGGQESRQMDNGEVGSFNIRIDVGTSGSNIYSCTIVAYDRDYPSDTRDERNLDVVVESNSVGNDRDNDGIRDGADDCPDQAENYNGYQDRDGCPDQDPNPDRERNCNDGIDNDGDGLIDGQDPDCPTSGGGIPWLPLVTGGTIVGLGYIFREEIKNTARGITQ